MVCVSLFVQPSFLIIVFFSSLFIDFVSTHFRFFFFLHLPLYSHLLFSACFFFLLQNTLTNYHIKMVALTFSRHRFIRFIIHVTYIQLYVCMCVYLSFSTFENISVAHIQRIFQHQWQAINASKSENSNGVLLEIFVRLQSF